MLVDDLPTCIGFSQTECRANQIFEDLTILQCAAAAQKTKCKCRIGGRRDLHIFELEHNGPGRLWLPIAPTGAVSGYPNILQWCQYIIYHCVGNPPIFNGVHP